MTLSKHSPAARSAVGDGSIDVSSCIGNAEGNKKIPSQRQDWDELATIWLLATPPITVHVLWSNVTSILTAS